MTINGVKIGPSKLLSKQELLAYMEMNGGTDRSLSEIRERYQSEFGNELVWRYPISDSIHAGGSIVVVKEGFAWLPYDWIDQDHNEIYELDQMKMFDEESIQFFIDDWISVSDDLMWAMSDMLCALKGAAPIIPAKRRMPSGRLAELFEKIIAVSSEMHEGADLYDLLHYKFCISNKELEQQGFEFQRYYISGDENMSDNNKCNCPICHQDFIPADGMTADEHLANGTITVYAELLNKATQKDCASTLPCPRCGHYNMNDRTTRNALSRVAQISVCDACGTEEAMQAANGNILPITSWWVVSEILGRNKLKCEQEAGETHCTEEAAPGGDVT